MTVKRSSTATLGRLFVVMMGMLVMASCNGGSSSSTTPTTPATNNTAALSVGFGPNLQAGGYVNGIFTSVTICKPGTSTCQTVDNVLVDTGSIGLRILNSALTTLPASSLGTIADSSNDQLQECIQYADTSYSWGPMWLADVGVGGEKASSIAVQVIGGNAGNPTFGTVPSTCLTTPVNPNLPNGGNEDTVATFGANGILGVGTAAYDCGSYCDPTNFPSITNFSGFPYYICPTGQACQPVGVPAADQAVNPVAFFSSSDNNGVMITLLSVPATGAASVSGTMNFGVGTQTDNALGSATLYALDTSGNIPSVTYNGLSYTYYNVLDTGSEGLDLSDHTTLGIADCTDNGYYCPSSTLTLSNIAVAGYGNVGSGTVSLSIANADTLFAANPTFAAFNNIGGDGGSSPASDLMDFGLPFFLGRTVFVGIAGTAVPNSANAPNGFVAF